MHRLEKLDAKIDATMKVRKIDVELKKIALPVGYVCVASYSGDEKLVRFTIWPGEVLKMTTAIIKIL